MLNPFAKYFDCLNCGNELISLNELTFHTPGAVVCDFCGQHYKGLTSRVKKVKTYTGFIFIIIAILIWSMAAAVANTITALFALFPVLIIYYFILAAVVGKASKLK